MTQDGQEFDWDDLKVFLAVARAGTLRGAAEASGANHTTLTRRLSILEDRIGSRLFDRSKAGLVLTQLGEDLLPYAQRVEDEMVSAARDCGARCPARRDGLLDPAPWSGDDILDGRSFAFCRSLS